MLFLVENFLFLLTFHFYQSQNPTPDKLRKEIEDFRLIEKDWKDKKKNALGN